MSLLNDLLESGGFVSDELVKREIVWRRLNNDGVEVESKFDIYIKKQAFATVEAIHGNEADKAKLSKYVSESIVDEKGNQVIPYEKAMLLHPALGMLFLAAVNEVNGTGAAKPKN